MSIRKLKKSEQLLKDMIKELKCPCTSGKFYDACCKPFHEGVHAPNPLLLMRSRFAAFALNLPDYIIETTHPMSPQVSENRFEWKRSISRFSKTTTFQKLEIFDYKEQGSQGTVTFCAHLLQEGQDASFTEMSHFEKIKGRWLYRQGHLEDGRVPNLITTETFRVLPLAYIGDPVLEKKGSDVKVITDAIKTLVKEMIETMDYHQGVGIAAPQVHHGLRLFVIREPQNSTERDFTPGTVKVFINPKITKKSETSWKAQEGCLSIPAIRMEVSRPMDIEVEYLDLDGNLHKESASGWKAKVILHEYDHIEGILFIDRLSEEEQEQIAPFVKRLKERLQGIRDM